mmetsp:Transcript_44043/g.42638  ORF Transcript_44043/g.42638 Transcript_44043/m.42638 type:complete len:96 (-) Transcript_44043:433-720(-)
MKRYGKNNRSLSDTKLLIKLHTAAITIQQALRRRLTRQGFYLQDGRTVGDQDSDIYIDSEAEAQKEKVKSHSKESFKDHKGQLIQKSGGLSYNYS